MPPKKKRCDAKIVNYYEVMDSKFKVAEYNPNYDLHGIVLPFRMTCVAPSGTGKSNFIINLIKLFCTGQGTFDSILIITRNKDEPLYNYLAEESEGLIKIVEGLRNLPALTDENFDKKVNHLVILDDLVLEKNLDAVTEYYIRCRKLNVSIAFLSQSFFRIPKDIRINADHAVFLKAGGRRDLATMLAEYSFSVTGDQLKGMFNHATSTKLVPFIIALMRPQNEMFRKGFDEYLDPAAFGG